MAAYAAVLSLNNIMDQIQRYHARRPVFLKEEQGLLESLKSKVDYLQDFLEKYSGNGRNVVAESLETQIAEASYAAEDIIESHVVGDIEARYLNDNNENSFMNDMGEAPYLAPYLSDNTENSSIDDISQTHIKNDIEAYKKLKARYLDDISQTHIKNDIEALYLEKQGIYAQSEISTHFSQKIEKINKNINFITEEAKQIEKQIEKQSKSEDYRLQDLEHVGSIMHPPTNKHTMVGFDAHLNHIVDKLTRKEYKVLQVIPITGMGGAGKTTLARNVYDNSRIVQDFDIRGWVTSSQDYNSRQALFSLLKETDVHISENEKESLEYHQLGDKLYKHLLNRRYFIIIDDLWSVEAWKDLKLYLPDNNNNSRIIVTTRLLTVAKNICSSDLHQVSFLDENTSWTLLCEIVFGQESSCPPEFEKIGKDIAKDCKGLPLSIVVIGGLLAKSDLLIENWKNIAQHINSAINSEDGDRCLKLLSLSYNHLPVHLKPCFLYMGIFPEDSEIDIEQLMRLWVAEGFLKLEKSKIPEEVAMDYLKDLMARNLIIDGTQSRARSMSSTIICKIHDLLRDFCLSEAQKHSFFSVMNAHNHDFSLQCIRSQRRCAILENSTGEVQLEPSPLLRSLVGTHCSIVREFEDYHNFKLLRIMYAGTYDDITDSWMLNSRYLRLSHMPRALEQMWFLQTLDFYQNVEYDATSKIWEMTELRHLNVVTLSLPDPLDEQNEFVLENLQSLSWVKNFRCTEKVLAKIPNINKLQISYEEPIERMSNYYRLNNLAHMQKLQTLSIHFELEEEISFHVEFPQSLKNLDLCSCKLTCDEMVTKIGPLPNLEYLELEGCSIGKEWNTVEGQFVRLKHLIIYYPPCVSWIGESSHFPQLEILSLSAVEWEEIPCFIGEIETLREIRLNYCSESFVASAMKILEEQRSFGNEDFRIVMNKWEDVI